VNAITRTGWRAYLPAAVRYVLALILLVILDAFWMGLIAPLLGVKYFDIVEAIQASDGGGLFALRAGTTVWSAVYIADIHATGLGYSLVKTSERCLGAGVKGGGRGVGGRGGAPFIAVFLGNTF